MAYILYMISPVCIIRMKGRLAGQLLDILYRSTYTCYMLYQTDLSISFNINATKCKPKKYFSHKEGGGDNVSISSNVYSDLYDINST